MGVANPKRYGDEAEAEQAARELLAKRPNFRFVEIITYEIRNGQRTPATLFRRV